MKSRSWGVGARRDDGHALRANRWCETVTRTAVMTIPIRRTP